ncbi:hypothetical protein RHD99_13900 [Buttiauxella selenatireducens]|uniref:Uncharacterized protein n=1 Tax=Buttiauxella selenatireducens TaxID=3073902 RepID=A0ABY9S4Y5_9ENTR|nr:hypothetical protein [Buttiauxella sp. R73]WMY72573.1 hypothetical protein RHD99_13900 [Buttiauxella sp. R73]
MKRIIGFLLLLFGILYSAYYYQRDIVKIPASTKYDLDIFNEERYVVQVEGGVIVNAGGNGTLINEYTVLANFTDGDQTTELLIKPDSRNSKVTWVFLKPVGKGKYYNFFRIQDEESKPMPHVLYTINACNETLNYSGRADSQGNSVAYFTEKECDIKIILDD